MPPKKKVRKEKKKNSPEYESGDNDGGPVNAHVKPTTYTTMSHPPPGTPTNVSTPQQWFPSPQGYINMNMNNASLPYQHYTGVTSGPCVNIFISTPTYGGDNAPGLQYSPRMGEGAHI